MKTLAGSLGGLAGGRGPHTVTPFRLLPGAPLPPSWRKALILVLIGIATAALLLAAASWQAARHDARAAAELLIRADQLRTALEDAETGQQAYLLTGDPTFLKPYETNRTAMDKHLASLEDAIAARPDLERGARDLPRLIDASMDRMAAAIALYQTKGADAAITAIKVGDGLRLLQQATGIIDYIEHSVEDRAAGQVDQEGRRALIVISLALAMSVLTSILLAVGGLLAIRRDRQLRQQLEAEVATRTQALDQTNRRLIDALAEKDKALAAREAALTQARLAEQAKSRFLAAASHDLRQPLQALQLFLATLRERLKNEEELHILARAVDALGAGSAVLAALVDLSEFDAGLVKPCLVSFDIGQLLAAVAAEFQPLAEAKRLDFKVVPCRRRVTSDSALLHRLLSNLVSNAVHHTQEGRVLVGCRRIGRQLRVEVWDTGPGIPPESYEAVFEDFVTLSNAHRDRQQGLGLGLSVARRIARLLDHELTIASRPGCGSCFAVTVSLPPR